MNDNSFDMYSDRAIMREIGAFIRTLRIRVNHQRRTKSYDFESL